MSSDLEMDFQTYVAPAYELRRTDLFPVGKPRLVKPKRAAFDHAVYLLLQTPKPTLKEDPRPPNPDELARLERSALAIAKTIGLLSTPLYPEKTREAWGKNAENRHESLSEWLQMAQRIHGMFETPAVEIGVGSVFIYLGRQSDGSRSMNVRAPFTDGALIYHAAQLIAKGAVSQTCEHCGGQFLSGGSGRGKDKKRSGSRFCSDECRWSHHNEMRKQGK